MKRGNRKKLKRVWKSFKRVWKSFKRVSVFPIHPFHQEGHLVFYFCSLEAASPTPPPQNCTENGGKCLGPNKCNDSVVLPGVFDCKGKRVCCQKKECPGTCLFKPNCKPIIARVPHGPYNCTKGDVCCEDIEIPECPGTCLTRKQCTNQGGTEQPRPHDCPRRRVCCILWWSAEPQQSYIDASATWYSMLL